LSKNNKNSSFQVEPKSSQTNVIQKNESNTNNNKQTSVEPITGNQITTVKRVLVADSGTGTNSPIQQVETETSFNLDALAKAVARHETASCTKGYGVEYNNCFGIKWGKTAPCDNVGRNNMCIYNDPAESYEAFKKIWSTWYGQMPTLRTAQIYSGNDRAHTWLANVTQFYYEYNQ
jgi:hypothetical protein